MKTRMMLILSLCVVILLMPYGALATKYDEYYSDRYDPITITEPYCEEESTAGEIVADNSKAVMAMLEVWYNLTEGEERSGKAAKDTLGAEIIRNMESGYYVFSCVTDSETSDVLSFVIGTAHKDGYGKVYWIEWNLKTQVIRAMSYEGIYVKNIKSGEEILQDYSFKSWWMAARGMNIIFNDYDETLNDALDTCLVDNADFPGFLRDAYFQTSGKEADF